VTTAPRSRPAAAPAYYLGRSADAWRSALRHRPHQAGPLGLIRPTTTDHGCQRASHPGATP
jgi:hypothetical protein